MLLFFLKRFRNLKVLHHADGIRPVEQDAGDENRPDHGGDDAHRQRNGKALDGAGGHPVQDDGGNEGGDVGVKDGGESLVKGVADSHAEGAPHFLFFPQAFVNQHVRVHRHAQGQHDTGNTRQRQLKPEDGHGPQKKQGIDRQAHDSHQTGKAVVDDHHDEAENQPRDARVFPLKESRMTQGGGDFAGGFKVELVGEGVGKHLRQGLRLAGRIQSADFKAF